MAKKPKQIAEETAGVPKAQLVKVVNECDGVKEQASEYAASHSTLVRNSIERHKLDRIGFGFARRVHKMEPGKAQASVTAFLDYVWKLGVLDQADAFDPVGEKLREILDDVEGRKVKSKPADTKAIDDFAALN
jgi:hypothetical protein